MTHLPRLCRLLLVPVDGALVHKPKVVKQSPHQRRLAGVHVAKDYEVEAGPPPFLRCLSSSRSLAGTVGADATSLCPVEREEDAREIPPSALSLLQVHLHEPPSKATPTSVSPSLSTFLVHPPSVFSASFPLETSHAHLRSFGSILYSSIGRCCCRTDPTSPLATTWGKTIGGCRCTRGGLTRDEVELKGCKI